jgi:hypothetical protein
MRNTFELANEGAKQRLLKLLAEAIQTDCEEGRNYLQEQVRSGGISKLLPGMYEIISKNVDVREAVYRKIIEDMKARKDFPISFNQFFGQFLSSFGSAVLPLEDPVKREYTNLVFGLIKPSDLPPESITAIVGGEGLSEGLLIKGGLRMPPEEQTPQNLGAIRARNLTINSLTRRVFENYFLASTGKDAISPSSIDPDYIRFGELMDSVLIPGMGPTKAGK